MDKWCNGRQTYICTARRSVSFLRSSSLLYCLILWYCLTRNCCESINLWDLVVGCWWRSKVRWDLLLKYAIQLHARIRPCVSFWKSPDQQVCMSWEDLVSLFWERVRWFMMLDLRTSQAMTLLSHGSSHSSELDSDWTGAYCLVISVWDWK